MTIPPDNPTEEKPADSGQSSKPTTAVEMLVWLQNVRNAHQQHTQAAAPEDRMDEALQRVDRAMSLMRGEIQHGDALDALRCLLAAGIASWDDYPADTALPTEQVIAYLVPSLLCEALWQIVIAQRLPEHSREALAELASPQAADWIMNVRAVWRNDPPRWHRTLYQAVASDAWQDVRQRLLDDMANPQGGAAAVENMLTARHGKRTSVNGRKSFLLAVLLSSVAGKAVEGVIGNNADRLVLQFLEWLQNFLGPEPVQAAEPDAQPQQHAEPKSIPSSYTPMNQYEEALANIMFCHIPAGAFQMGDSQSEWSVDRPLHQVSLVRDYWIGQTPVTASQFLAYCYLSGQRVNVERLKDWQKQTHNHPVVNVTWREALAFCDWLTAHYRKRYGWSATAIVTLPSEAEWEKAARGGERIPTSVIKSRARDGMHVDHTPVQYTNPRPARHFPWGDDAPDKSRCNIENYFGHTTPVGQFSPRGDSPYGCCDMAGNVWEWTRSIAGRLVGDSFEWTRYPYHPGDWREDLQRGDEWHRVLRGGSWGLDHDVARAAYRFRYDPDSRNVNLGFRVVCAPVP